MISQNQLPPSFFCGFLSFQGLEIQSYLHTSVLSPVNRTIGTKQHNKLFIFPLQNWAIIPFINMKQQQTSESIMDPIKLAIKLFNNILYQQLFPYDWQIQFLRYGFLLLVLHCNTK